ncbi:hypothetical protein QE152_g26246 [Popillia japonica]|uniref:Uncharacterized protein n=1 Tax=Popillia japonica TaxID=7064 RepID=A0AAW1JYZ5_POPJA
MHLPQENAKGDSDAEENLLHTIPKNVTSLRTARTFAHLANHDFAEPHTNNDFDSDDSTADPSYDQDGITTLGTHSEYESSNEDNGEAEALNDSVNIHTNWSKI